MGELTPEQAREIMRIIHSVRSYLEAPSGKRDGVDLFMASYELSPSAYVALRKIAFPDDEPSVVSEEGER